MQHQIVKVNDIDAAIREHGLDYYIDRLVQDAAGEYFYIEYRISEPVDTRAWKRTMIRAYDEDPDNPATAITVEKPCWYLVYRLPRDVAFFIIDALRIQAMIKDIGASDYGDGPHFGQEATLLWEGDGFRDITRDVRLVRTEDLGGRPEGKVMDCIGLYPNDVPIGKISL